MAGVWLFAAPVGVANAAAAGIRTMPDLALAVTAAGAGVDFTAVVAGVIAPAVRWGMAAIGVCQARTACADVLVILATVE